MNTLFERTIGKDEWLTPPEIVRALGPFSLDPCSPIDRPWPTATCHMTINDDGLRSTWFGRVWCNPPYGRELPHWLRKCAEHRNATALVFARTETEAFHRWVWPEVHGIMFFEGRIQFYRVDGTCIGVNAGAPSVLLAFDEHNAEILRNSMLKGHFIHNKPSKK